MGILRLLVAALCLIQIMHAHPNGFANHYEVVRGRDECHASRLHCSSLTVVKESICDTGCWAYAVEDSVVVTDRCGTENEC